MVSSLCLIGTLPYSAAVEMISINPLILVLLFSDILNKSEKKQKNIDYALFMNLTYLLPYAFN